MVHQETAYRRVLSIFKTNGAARYPFVTLITTEKGNKKDTPYGWETMEKAKEYIDKRAANYRANEASDIARKEASKKAAAKEFLDNLKEGDILCSMWGYEAQWYDFYKVVGKQGSFVLLRELKKTHSQEDCKYGWASYGYAAPTDEFESDQILKRKVKDHYVEINSYATAHLWDGVPREEANWH